MMKFSHILFFLFMCVSVFPQRLYKLSATVNGEEKEISYLVNHGLDYVSAKELGNFLCASEFFNTETGKLELKFESGSIKFTGKNQFIVIQEAGKNSNSVIQIPISTLLIQDDIYIPFLYVKDHLAKISKSTINFNDREKSISITYIKAEVKLPTIITNGEEKPAEVKTSNTTYDVYDMHIDEKANGTMITLKANQLIRLPRYSINNGKLYVFLSNSLVAPGLSKKIKPIGLIKEFQQNSISARNTQLEFLLNDGYSSVEAFKDSQSNDVIIAIHNNMMANKFLEGKSKWNFDCVVIDAGHGGKDPGTIGVNGVKEKNVNLAIALKLGKLIEKEIPDLKIVYTRSDDQFVELYRRGKIANEAGGKLFISIHCNSTEKKDNGVRGFEVYLLRPGKTKEAIRIAELENSVVTKYEENQDKYEKLTDENFILVTMAHSQFVRYSETFSDLLNQTWKNSVEVPSLGIKQAGFYVLVGASMPSVLIETGFLSNRKEEAYLASNAGQTTIAETILASVKKYKEFYEKENGK